MTRAALPVADKLGICLVSPSATSNEFLGRDDNLIRLSSSTTDFGALYSALLLEKGYMNCGLILDLKNGAYTESWLKAFVSHYVNRGGKILNVQFIDSSRKSDFRDELNLFLESGAGVLVVNASSMDSAALIQELRKMGSSVPVFVSEWAGTDHFIKLGGRAVEGVVVLQPFDPYDESEEFVQFYRSFTERYNEEPSYVAIAAYDATLVVLQALFNRKAGESMKEAILNNSPYEGLQQEIIFNKFGDTRRLALFQEVREGQFRKFE
ncbi:MAG: ABC transporter substrate-binding protein [Spirochaetales bacterium]|nr:ABC transporter substrate-binding protein [Spirochaetales bacterium]